LKENRVAAYNKKAYLYDGVLEEFMGQKLNWVRATTTAAVLIGLLMGQGVGGANASAFSPWHFCGQWQIRARMPHVNIARGIKNLVIRPTVSMVEGGGKAALKTGKIAYGGWQLYSTVHGEALSLAPLLAKKH
jgi:hypothetical protein